MKIEIVAGEDEEAIATFIINGIDEIAESELQKKDGVTKPRVTLSFELSRSFCFIEPRYRPDAISVPSNSLRTTQCSLLSDRTNIFLFSE